MYSRRESDYRRCRSLCKDGHICCNYACRGDVYCIDHGGVRRGGVGRAKGIDRSCRCVAYSFPHKAGTGRCRYGLFTRLRDAIDGYVSDGKDNRG